MNNRGYRVLYKSGRGWFNRDEFKKGDRIYETEEEARVYAEDYKKRGKIKEYRIIPVDSDEKQGGKVKRKEVYYY